MKTKSLEIILSLAIILVVASGFAFTWEQVNPNIHFGELGMSADGRIICAVPSGTHPVISTDSGETWSALSGNPPIGSVNFVGGMAVSADGANIYATLRSNSVATNWVFVSRDRGTNWTQTSFPSTPQTGNLLVACSSNGTNVITAAVGGPIYYSTNGGSSCYTSSVPVAQWKSVASSASGLRLAAADNSGGIYFSEDLGASWNKTSFPGQSWNSVCVSGDGNWVGAASGTESLISSDFGVTWQTNSLSGLSIACSANGSNWVIVNGNIFTSTNRGSSWQTNLASAVWNAGAMSADGDEIVVFGSGQGTWLGRETPQPQLTIQWQNSDVAVSWLLPSTNFVVQQSADLTSQSWTPVSSNPTLNYTNLQEGVTVPMNGSNAFFRLIAQ
jgi:hypothetical protein